MSPSRRLPASEPGDRTRLPLASDPPICHYFEAGRCRSCTLIETPAAQQLHDKEQRCRALLPGVPEQAWLPSVPGGVRDFRNKAKLVVGGRPGRVTLGILGPDGTGVDLRDCLIQQPAIRTAIPHLARFIEDTGLPPYDVPKRRGELKFVHVTVSPADELMLRFVVRSEQALEVLRNSLPRLRRAVPAATVVSVNLLPEHKAVLEGEHEELLLGSSLAMDTGAGFALHLRPQSFFQTNTEVARALYAQAAEWVGLAGPSSLWDLYCGVGGFALHCAGAVPSVLGVEISEEAVRSARRSAREAGIAARFEAGDATAFALGSDEVPEAVIVNPPRRGIGGQLAAWLKAADGITHVVYSSCNPESLATDLAAMPAFVVREARVFDMFPHTRHLEVAVLLERR